MKGAPGVGDKDMKKPLVAMALLLASALPVAAQAAVTISFDDKVTISSSNDFKSQLNALGLTKYSADDVSLVLTENSIITFYLLGSESGFNDSFATISTPNLIKSENTPFQNNFGAPISIGSGAFNAGSLAGRLNFSSVGGKSATVGDDGFGIFLTRMQQSGSSVSTFYFGYDDQIQGADNDYDDLIIKAVVTSAVPEPATWAMFLIGFAAVGGAMRARRRKQTLSVSYS